MSAVREWVRSFAVNRRAKHFANGFSWAATELLQGKSVEEIESYIDYAIDSNGFESGAYAAIAKWEKLREYSMSERQKT